MLFPPIGHDWRPRSSWKLPSSHLSCRAIRALKEPSDCLKGAEEGWEFLSHWKLLKDINFYYHFAQPSLFLSHALVYPLQLGGALFFLYPGAGNVKGVLFLCFLFFLVVVYGAFGAGFLADMCERGWSLKQGDGTDVSCGCVSGLLVCVYDQRLQIYSVVEEIELWQDLLPKFKKLKNPVRDLDWIRVALVVHPIRGVCVKLFASQAFWFGRSFVVIGICCCFWLFHFKIKFLT